MKKIGVMYGRENTFPGALVAKINEQDLPDLRAESLTIGAVTMEQLYDYQVIVDRVSHELPFYRAALKHAMLQGVTVINNPFWWTADDKFFDYALAKRLGVAVPKTALLPHKQHPHEIVSQSLRNLEFPLNWEEIFAYIGFPAFLKPYIRGSWKEVYKVHSPAEFFAAYDQTGDQCMLLQAAIEFTDYFRCLVVGPEKVHVMRFDPRLPSDRRYSTDGPPLDPKLHARLVTDSLTLCRALGYDINAVEFAVQDGVAYAIDFLNPAPDVDYHSIGPENFRWVVEATAELAIAAAQKKPVRQKDFRWAKFL